jgi:hypothetical protein
MNKLITLIFFCSFSLLIFSQECIEGNCKNGSGTVMLANGDKFVGKFKNGQFSFGTFSWADGRIFKGNMEDGMLVEGTMTFPKYKGIVAGGLVYKGQFKDGMMHGTGTITKPNSSYTGQMQYDKAHGKGLIINPKYTYDGFFKKGERHGIGTTSYSKGAMKGMKYVGDYLDDLRNGIGVFTSPDGFKYEGEWKNDMQHG